MDLPTTGERVVTAPVLSNGRILFTTLIPSTGVCSGGGTGWLMELDSEKGSALQAPTFDVDGDGDVDESDHLGTVGDHASGVKSNSIPSSVTLQKNPGGPGGGTLNKLKSQSLGNAAAPVAGSLEIDVNTLPSLVDRSSWRQIF